MPNHFLKQLPPADSLVFKGYIHVRSGFAKAVDGQNHQGKKQEKKSNSHLFILGEFRTLRVTLV